MRAEARASIDYVKASPPQDTGRPVLGPGDIERRTRAARLANGVPLDDKTWSDLLEAAQSVGIDAQWTTLARAALIINGGR